MPSSLLHPYSSDPALMSASNPSMSTMSHSSKLGQIGLVVIVFFGLCCLVLTFYIYISKTKSNKDEAKLKETMALEVKHINAQSIRDEEKDNDSENDQENPSGFVSFSLFTTPPGAEVYENGHFVGITPIDMKRMSKNEEPSKFIIILEGYNTVRKEIRLSENFSDAIDLSKIKKDKAHRSGRDKGNKADNADGPKTQPSGGGVALPD